MLYANQYYEVGAHANNIGSSMPYYRGKIPFALYLKLQNTFPQAVGETDIDWLRRTRQHPMLAQQMFGTLEFKTELMQAVQRRLMAQAMARRVGQTQRGPALVGIRTKSSSNAKRTFADRYVDEFMVKSGNSLDYKYKQAAYDMLLEQFDAATPVNGSIFWNGINELALAKLVDQWNREFGREIFGQLEATTAARYVNKQFEWDPGTFPQYFVDVSDRLGHAARGHVTSVVRCGLRFDSVFTQTELPRMLKSMSDQIQKDQTPSITDITIVVIEPKTQTEQRVKSFTNNEITQIPIVRPLPGRRINSPDDCTVDTYLDINTSVKAYWTLRGIQFPSLAATEIMGDFSQLITWP